MISSVAWSPDGRFLVGGDAKGDVWLWHFVAKPEANRLTGHLGKVSALAFSRDGLRLASGSYDTTVLVWNLRGLTQQIGKTMQLSTADDLWAALREKEVTNAWTAMQVLIQNPDIALPLLRERLKPKPMPNQKHVEALLAQLDDDNFQTRVRAAEHLEKMGSAMIEPALLDALAKKPSPEVRASIQKLLGKITTYNLSPGELQAFRGIEVLERIGSPGARQVLEELSQMPAKSTQTKEASAALQRLSKPTHAMIQ